MTTSQATEAIPTTMIRNTLVKILASASAPQSAHTGSTLVARSQPPIKHPMVVVYMLSACVILAFALLMFISIHKSVMAARERRLESQDNYQTGNVFLKLVKCIWAGAVVVFCSFFSLFTKQFWKQLWSDLKFFFSPYSWFGVWVNAYTCGCLCNADPDYDPELAGIIGQKKEINDIVSKEPAANGVIAATGTPAPQRPAPAVVAEHA